MTLQIQYTTISMTSCIWRACLELCTPSAKPSIWASGYQVAAIESGSLDLNLSQIYGAECSTLFAIKCLVKTEPTKIIVCLFCFTIFIFSNTLRICEYPFDRVLQGPSLDYRYINSVWAVMVTITTGRLELICSWIRRYLPDQLVW